MDLFKFREMRATRRLLWHSDFAKFDFRPELVIKYSDEAFCAPPLLRCLCSAALKRIHTATPDTTKLSCLCRVRFGGANWSADRQLKTVAVTTQTGRSCRVWLAVWIGHLTVEFYAVVMQLTFILIIISIPSPPQSFILGLKPSCSAKLQKVL